MFNSKRTLPTKKADSEFMKNLLKELGEDESSNINPEADALEKSLDSIPSNEFMGKKRLIKSRYSSLGDVYINDEIVSKLTPENIDSYMSLLEFVSSTKKAIKYYSKEIERLDLEAASAERSGNSEKSSHTKSEANKMQQKLNALNESMGKIPDMISKWKQSNSLA